MDKEFLMDESCGPKYKLLQLSDQGGLKYPSELVLDSIIIIWKILTCIENNNDLMALFVEGPSRKILMDLSMCFIFDVDNNCKGWKNACSSCSVDGSLILSRLILMEGNCLIANKVKNYNSRVCSKGLEKRKLANNTS